MKQINVGLCDTCGGNYWCVSDCITEYIEIGEPVGEEGRFLRFKDRGRCIDCKHCIAVCPKEAIFEDTGISEDENVMIRFFASKRSIRFYDQEKKVSEDALELILKAAQTSPTEKNRSTVRIVIIKERLVEFYFKALSVMKEIVEKTGSIHPQYHMIMKLYDSHGPVLWNAEYLVLVIGNPDYSIDAALLAERMQLMAHSLGVGTTYNGNIVMAVNQDEGLRKELNINKREKVHVAFAMGIPKVKYFRPVFKNNKKVHFM